uniref:Spondin-like TSP1 domain-containing protein n=1 Tax=Stegastes partitus TaxID=144197 RepID=A0A3B4ZIA7_9TELE
MSEESISLGTKHHSTLFQVDGALSPWGPWSPCSLSCGGLGLKTRSRGCTNPAPVHGGRDCQGPRQETTYCQRNCSWTEWGAWGSCSRSCGVGQQQRIRTFLIPGTNGSWCEDILGGNLEHRFCNIKFLAEFLSPTLHCWSRWSPWSRCDKRCGGGRSIRTRSCSSPPPKNGGKKCEGEKNQVKPCNTKPCGETDQTCTHMSCSDHCDLRSTYSTPKYGRITTTLLQMCGSLDFGMHPMTKCFVLFPVDGGWTPWSVWSDCSVTCGQGTHVRTRACINPPPRNNGSHCTGPERETQHCQTSPCLG